MLDPSSFKVLRRAQESAQSAEPTRYDAPPGEPDVYAPDEYPPGFGPNASKPDRQFSIYGFTIAAGAKQQFTVPWHAEYVYIVITDTVGVQLRIYTSDALTDNYQGIIGPKGHAKIPCNQLNPPEFWLFPTGATATGIIAFLRGCEYENAY